MQALGLWSSDFRLSNTNTEAETQDGVTQKVIEVSRPLLQPLFFDPQQPLDLPQQGIVLIVPLFSTHLRVEPVNEHDILLGLVQQIGARLARLAHGVLEAAERQIVAGFMENVLTRLVGLHPPGDAAPAPDQVTDRSVLLLDGLPAFDGR